MGPLTVIGNRAWFQANDGERGNELWITDGTPEGTRLVKDICPGSGGSDPHYFVEAGSRTYFCANDREHGIELWSSDGTSEGTTLVADIFPGTVGSEPWSLVEFQGMLYLCADSPDFGEEVFRTNGTSEETKLLVDIVPGPVSSGPDNLTNLKNQRLLFTCSDGSHGEELWGTDGTASGTVLVADIRKHRTQTSPSSSPHDLTALDTKLLFAAGEREHGDELWVSDASSDGTLLVRDIYPGPADSRPEGFVRLGAGLLFSAKSPESGRELWRTDGTSGGTVLVKDILGGPVDSNPRMSLASGDVVYFVADDDTHADALWRTDGHQAGTTSLTASTPALSGGHVEELFELRGRVYYYVVNSKGARALWTIRAVNNLPHLLEPVVTPTDIRTALQVPATAPASDAHAGGDLPARLVIAIHPPGGTRSPHRTIDFGNLTLFVAYTIETGSELWKTDGTIEGTSLVADCFPGPASASPVLLAASQTAFLFVADHPQHGRVLWESDGTLKGTGVITQVDSIGHAGYPLTSSECCFLREKIFAFVGATTPERVGERDLFVVDRTSGNNRIMLRGTLTELGSSDAHSITQVGEVVFFVADDGTRGEELWKLGPEMDVPVLVRDIFPYSEIGNPRE
jgi:ELWxxDGT repeat protein